jgi:hypothetical protein
MMFRYICPSEGTGLTKFLQNFVISLWKFRGNPDLLTIAETLNSDCAHARALQSRAESDYQQEVNKRGVQDLFADILYNQQDVRSSGDETNKRKEEEEESEGEEEEQEQEGREQQEEEEREAASTRKMALVKSSRFSRTSDSFR